MAVGVVSYYVYAPMLGVGLLEPEDGRYRPKYVVFPC